MDRYPGPILEARSSQVVVVVADAYHRRVGVEAGDRRLEGLLGRNPTTKLTAEDIKALVASLQDITAALAAADPADKAKVYAAMGIDITYHQDGRVVVESRPRVVESGVGERTRTSTSTKLTRPST